MVQGKIKMTKNLNPPCWTFMTVCTLAPNFFVPKLLKWYPQKLRSPNKWKFTPINRKCPPKNFFELFKINRNPLNSTSAFEWCVKSFPNQHVTQRCCNVTSRYPTLLTCQNKMTLFQIERKPTCK
jgi:hypothetical protein